MNGGDAIVVGGGIVGATTAWELSRAGMDVLLLEARRIAEQSTGKSAAIVRCHYSNPEVVRMAIRSRETLRRLPLLLECNPVFERRGWLFLVDEASAETAAANAEMQDEEGLEVLDVEDVDEYLPGANTDGVAYALYEPDSGFADPIATTLAYVAAARRHGARAVEGMRVGSLHVVGGVVRGVLIGGEIVEAERVVLAAGPWTAKLAAGAGVDLPLTITREQDVVFATAPEPTITCAVSSQVDRFYMRPAPEHGDAHVLVGRGFPKQYEPAEPDRYDATVDAEFEADVYERVTGRVPRLVGMRHVAGRVGLYDVTPDWHPILGAVDELPGLYLATGGSGHCFKLAPAIGELVAAQILGRTVGYADAASFSLTRFAAGREFRSTYGGNRA